MGRYIKPVIFKLGEESYGIDIESVSSIETKVNVVSVPNTSSYIKGIINLRNQVIPVINLKKKFNLNSVSEGESEIIVKINNLTFALEVDAVEEIQNIDVSHVSDMPKIVRTGDLKYFDKVAEINGKLVILLNLNYLLNEKEQQSIQNVAEEFVNE